MAGDQIYADDLSFIAPDHQPDEFLSRYRKVFGQKHIRELMGRLPTYMTLDDHEISNDWDQDRVKDEADLFAAAMHAYECYQFVHGPGFQFSGKPDSQTHRKSFGTISATANPRFLSWTRERSAIHLLNRRR